jgi:NADH:ubiquinone oxidoreductase subunit 6 (subunit J)
MNLALLIIAFVMLGSAAIAMGLRNLIHSALLLIASWAAIAAFFLWAGAEFLAFAQVLVYVGAVSMVVLFAVLLTRQSRLDLNLAPVPFGRALGALIAGSAVAGILFGAILGTPLPAAAAPPPGLTVRQLGLQLMGTHAAALLVVGVILTVALLGAIVLASNEAAPKTPEAR